MKDWTGTAIQREALTVPCGFCRAPIDSLCTAGGKVLEAFPAHDVRIRAAEAARAS